MFGIDPKGMELAYGRGIFARYAVTARGALVLLDELVEEMNARKTSHAGRVRVVDIPECPLELVEIDEIAALTKYTGDRKTREAITERIGVLNTQGRALDITVRDVQEPNKDVIPIRDVFPCRVCLRVPTKSHVAMALGDHAWDPGAWANRIGESEAGVGYLFGRGHPRTAAGALEDRPVRRALPPGRGACLVRGTDQAGGVTHAQTALTNRHVRIDQRRAGGRRFSGLCRFRDPDGVTRKVEHNGPTEAKAKNRLREALRDRAQQGPASGRNGDSRFRVAAEEWIAGVDLLVTQGERSPNTAQIYRLTLDSHVLPAVGELRLREVTVPRLDRVIQSMQLYKGTATAKIARTVISGVMGLAVRYGAVATNPVRDIARIAGQPKRPPRALTTEERQAWVAQLDADSDAVLKDLPDLSSGCSGPGSASARRWRSAGRRSTWRPASYGSTGR